MMLRFFYLLIREILLFIRINHSKFHDLLRGEGDIVQHRHFYFNNPSRLRSSGRKPNPSFTASEGFLMFFFSPFKIRSGVGDPKNGFK